MQSPFHLADKTILITGASSGIGRQAAICCAAMGATVWITGRNCERLESTYERLEGNTHKMLTCDLAKEDAVQAFVENMPALDGVVHCAGIVKPYPIQFLNRQKIDETFHANLHTAVYLTSALFRQKKMNIASSLVFLSSITGQHPGKGSAMYAASKAGVEAFAKTVAAEYAHKQIRANIISPAMVKTPMYDYSAVGEFEQAMENHIAQYPLGVGEPEDVANAIVFLLSPASRWITGINIIMDGGFTLA